MEQGGGNFNGLHSGFYFGTVLGFCNRQIRNSTAGVTPLFPLRSPLRASRLTYVEDFAGNRARNHVGVATYLLAS